MDKKKLIIYGCILLITIFALLIGYLGFLYYGLYYGEPKEKIISLKKLCYLHIRYFPNIKIPDYTGGERTNLSGIDMNGAYLYKANLGSNSNWKGSRFNLSESNLSNCFLVEANLGSVDFIGTKLNRANLSGADLSNSFLVSADLREANLQGANLTMTNLASASLSKANLTNANLSEIHMPNTDLSGANLFGVKNLNHLTICQCKKIDGITGISKEFLLKIKAEKPSLMEWWNGEDRTNAK